MARNKKLVEEKYNAPFPTALRTLMEERGETQENIAKAAGKTRQTISQYVNGISEPGYDVLIKIADYFDVSIDYLLGRTGDPNRLPCAADELGLSSLVIQRLKKYAFSPQTNGINAFLEGTVGYSALFAMIGELVEAVKKEQELSPESIVDYVFDSDASDYADWESFLKSNNRREHDIAVEMFLKHELYNRFPALRQHSGRIIVKYGCDTLYEKVNEICDCFRYDIESISGFRDFIESTKGYDKD